MYNAKLSLDLDDYMYVVRCRDTSYVPRAQPSPATILGLIHVFLDAYEDEGPAQMKLWTPADDAVNAILLVRCRICV